MQRARCSPLWQRRIDREGLRQLLRASVVRPLPHRARPTSLAGILCRLIPMRRHAIQQCSRVLPKQRHFCRAQAGRHLHTSCAAPLLKVQCAVANKGPTRICDCWPVICLRVRQGQINRDRRIIGFHCFHYRQPELMIVGRVRAAGSDDSIMYWRKYCCALYHNVTGGRIGNHRE
jgi:hypothetical protein